MRIISIDPHILLRGGEVKNLSKQKNNQNEKVNSAANKQGSGTEYHNKHAGHIEGYGEIDPNAEHINQSTEGTN